MSKRSEGSRKMDHALLGLYYNESIDSPVNEEAGLLPLTWLPSNLTLDPKSGSAKPITLSMDKIRHENVQHHTFQSGV